MKYIDVLSKFSPSSASRFDPMPYAIKQSDGVLVSLRKDTQKRHLQRSLFYHTPNRIKEVRERYSKLKKIKIWVDSGGYDFFKSTRVDEKYIQVYLDYYLTYLEEYRADFHRIFSLDFQPAIRKDNLWFNTTENIYQWNKRSIIESLKLVNKQGLQKKFCFVYHSKTRQLYEIWGQLYRELGLQNIVHGRAIGGLVGVYKLSKEGTGHNLMFSPVIGPAFNALNDYLKAGNYHHNFSLHFLGVSNPIDRFVILVIESIFKKYFVKIGITRKVKFTYDSRSYSTDANKEAKTSEIFIFQKNKHDKPLRLPDPTLLNHKRLQEIYYDKTSLDTIVSEIENTIWDDRLISTEHYYALFIWSNRNLDRYFKEFIKKNSIVHLISNANNTETLKQDMDNIFNDLVPSIELLKNDSRYKDHKYEQSCRSPLYDIWSEDMIKKVICSCEKIFQFTNWMYHCDCDSNNLNELMINFINDMGIKNSLT